LRPQTRVLFAQPHPGVNADDKLGHMLRACDFIGAFSENIERLAGLSCKKRYGQ